MNLSEDEARLAERYRLLCSQNDASSGYNMVALIALLAGGVFIVTALSLVAERKATLSSYSVSAYAVLSVAAAFGSIGARPRSAAGRKSSRSFTAFAVAGLASS